MTIERANLEMICPLSTFAHGKLGASGLRDRVRALREA
jgi:hypothetical protein